MKKFLFVILAMIGLSNASCSEDDDSSAAPGITAAQVNTLIVDGNWRVTLYDESGVNQTSDYSGYSFDFNADGSVVATSGGTIKTGTWTTTPDSGSIKMPILFPLETDGPFESISEDWRVLTVNNTKLELEHISGGDGSIDLLTFEKI